MSAGLQVVDLDTELATLAPGLPSRLVGSVNDDCLKLSVYAGEGDWHAHSATDELFLVLEGRLVLDVFEGATVTVGPRQIVTIPAGVIHRPRADVRSVILCFKPQESPTNFYEMAVSSDAE